MVHIAARVAPENFQTLSMRRACPAMQASTIMGPAKRNANRAKKASIQEKGKCHAYRVLQEDMPPAKTLLNAPFVQVGSTVKQKVTNAKRVPKALRVLGRRGGCQGTR